MIIFKCLLSGDEMFSDTFKYKLSEDGVFYVVDGKIVTRKEGFDDSLIGANASAEEATESSEDAVFSGVDIALNHKLQETAFNKEAYMSHLKAYVKAVRAKLQEESPERAEKFAADVPKAVKNVIKSFKDLQFFTGESMNVDGMVGLLNFNEDDKPYMLFFKEGLIAEKV